MKKIQCLWYKYFGNVLDYKKKEYGMDLSVVSPTNLEELLPIMMSNQLPIMIKGGPGVGKSDITAAAAEKCGFELIIAHPVVDDPTDYKGFPFIVNGVADFVPFNNLRRIMNATKPTVFFLDDLGQAAPSVQAACMQLLLAREINGKKISDKVTFVAATNRREDRAGVTGILEPVKSRFVTIVQLVPDLDSWVSWALTHGMPPELISFIRFRPGFMDGFKATSDITNTPCPRTIANLGTIMNTGIPSYLEKAAFAGAVGQEMTIEFTSFLDVYRSLPDIENLIEKPDSKMISKNPAVLFAITTAVSYRANKSNLRKIMQVFDILPKEYGIFGVTDMVKRDPDLQKTKEYTEWAISNAGIMLGAK